MREISGGESVAGGAKEAAGFLMFSGHSPTAAPPVGMLQKGIWKNLLEERTFYPPLVIRAERERL